MTTSLEITGAYASVGPSLEDGSSLSSPAPSTGPMDDYIDLSDIPKPTPLFPDITLPMVPCTQPAPLPAPAGGPELPFRRRSLTTVQEWAKVLMKHFFGCHSPRRSYLTKAGLKRDAWRGWFDRSLSRVCRKGQPQHWSNEMWLQHLEARDHLDFQLPYLRWEDIARALADPGVRLYVVGNCHQEAEILWAILDFDDKERTNKITRVINRFKTAYPAIYAAGIIRTSPGGYGRSMLLKVDCSGYSHEQANHQLAAISNAIIARINDKASYRFDAIKATWPWVNYVTDEFGDSHVRTTCQGVYASLPLPRNQCELDQMINQRVMTLGELSQAVTEALIHNNSINPLPHTVCREVNHHAGPRQADANTRTPALCVHSVESARRSGKSGVKPQRKVRPSASSGLGSGASKCVIQNDRWQSFEGIRSDARPQARKSMLAFKMSHESGQPLPDSNETADQLARVYVENRLNHNAPDWMQLRKQFRQALKWIHRTWDWSLAGGQGPMSSRFDWVDKLDVTQFFADYIKSHHVLMQACVGTLKVFLYLVEKRDRQQEIRYRFTTGRNAVTAYIAAARTGGNRLKAVSDPKLVSRATDAAQSLGLVKCIQAASKGKTAARWMLDKAHPRFMKWCETYADQLRAYPLAVQLMPPVTQECHMNGYDQMAGAPMLPPSPGDLHLIDLGDDEGEWAHLNARCTPPAWPDAGLVEVQAEMPPF